MTTLRTPHKPPRAYRRQLLRQIKRDGYIVSVALPILDEPGFAYSAGLHRAGLPELIVIGGLIAPEQYAVLHRLAAQMRSGKRFDPGQRLDDILEDFEATFVEVVDTATPHFDVVNSVQSGYRALQLVWPDHDNRFPWDDGYGLLPEQQPLLGLPPG